jgi:capsular polysaccharide biosynthesis protein
MAKTDAGSVFRAALARWPIVIVASLVVGAAAFGYAMLTTEGPTQEAVSAIRIETVAGIPTQPTVDMAVGMAKSASTLGSAAESAGVDAAVVGNVTAYADPNDLQLARIAVQADDPETAEAVADAMAEQVQGMLVAVLEPELSFHRQLSEDANERLELLEQEYDAAIVRLEGNEYSEEESLSVIAYVNGVRSNYWAQVDRAVTADFNLGRYESVAAVEGKAAAVEVTQTGDIVGLTVQGLLIGAIAGVAVAFVLGYSDARKKEAAA